MDASDRSMDRWTPPPSPNPSNQRATHGRAGAIDPPSIADQGSQIITPHPTKSFHASPHPHRHPGPMRPPPPSLQPPRPTTITTIRSLLRPMARGATAALAVMAAAVATAAAASSSSSSLSLQQPPLSRWHRGGKCIRVNTTPPIHRSIDPSRINETLLTHVIPSHSFPQNKRRTPTRGRGGQQGQLLLGSGGGATPKIEGRVRGVTNPPDESPPAPPPAAAAPTPPLHLWASAR